MNAKMKNRFFVLEYKSVNGAANFKVGDEAQIIDTVDNTDFNVVVNGEKYTLPIMDFLEATKNSDG